MLLTVISGFVSFDRTRLIRWLRSAVVRVSMQQTFSDHCTTLSTEMAGGSSPFYATRVEIRSLSSKNASDWRVLSKFIFRTCGAAERQDPDPAGTI